MPVGRGRRWRGRRPPRVVAGGRRSVQRLGAEEGQTERQGGLNSPTRSHSRANGWMDV